MKIPSTTTIPTMVRGNSLAALGQCADDFSDLDQFCRAIQRELHEITAVCRHAILSVLLLTMRHSIQILLLAPICSACGTSHSPRQTAVAHGKLSMTGTTHTTRVRRRCVEWCGWSVVKLPQSRRGRPGAQRRSFVGEEVVWDWRESPEDVIFSVRPTN